VKRALSIVFVLVTSLSAHAQNPRRVLREAIAEYQAGNYAESRALFLEAHEMRPSARLLRGAGMASFELREYVTALGQLEAALATEERALTRQQRREVEELLERTQRYIGRFRIEVTPPEAEVRVDGRAPVPDDEGKVLLDLGEHRVESSAEGYLPLERTVEVHGGEDETLDLAMESVPVQVEPRRAPPPLRFNPALTWALVGAGAGLVGTAIGTSLWWLGRRSEVDRCQQAVADGHRCLNLGTLEQQSLGAGLTTFLLGLSGLTALAVGLLRLRWSADDDDEPEVAPPEVACAVGLGVLCRARF